MGICWFNFTVKQRFNSESWHSICNLSIQERLKIVLDKGGLKFIHV